MKLVELSKKRLTYAVFILTGVCQSLYINYYFIGGTGVGLAGSNTSGTLNKSFRLSG